MGMSGGLLGLQTQDQLLQSQNRQLSTLQTQRQGGAPASSQLDTQALLAQHKAQTNLNSAGNHFMGSQMTPQVQPLSGGPQGSS